MNRTKPFALLAALLALTLTCVSCSDDSDSAADASQDSSSTGLVLRSVVALAKSDSVQLIWSSPQDKSSWGGVRISWGSSAVDVAKGTNTYTVTGLSLGTKYTFNITPLDSSMSAAGSVKTVSVTTTVSSSGGSTSGGDSTGSDAAVAGEPLSISLEAAPDNAVNGKTNTSVTVTAVITTASAVKKVVYKKDGTRVAADLLADTDAVAATVDASDNTKWTFTLTAADETANGTYTVAAIDNAGREETEQITIAEFDFTAPANVTGVKSTYDSTAATITRTWTDPADDDFDHVLISYITNDGTSDSAESEAVAVAKGTQTYTLESVDGTVQYYKFTIKSVDKLGNTSEGLSKKRNIATVPEGFVFVDGGTFDGTSTLTPSSSVFISGRSITIGDLYVCDHEVTQGEYETYCAYSFADPVSIYGDGDNYPAYYVNWYNAIVYCNLRSMAEGLTPVYSINRATRPFSWTGIKSITTDGVKKYYGPITSNTTWDNVTFNTSANGYRLPTEAEWEYIARGGSSWKTYTYSGSDSIAEVAWYNGNSSSTHEVKTKAANSLGIYDMTGNVSEWCYDWYSYSISTSTAATGPASGEHRVIRGGYWGSSDYWCIFSDRDHSRPYSNFWGYGFRVVRNAE